MDRRVGAMCAQRIRRGDDAGGQHIACDGILLTSTTYRASSTFSGSNRKSATPEGSRAKAASTGANRVIEWNILYRNRSTARHTSGGTSVPRASRHTHARWVELGPRKARRWSLNSGASARKGARPLVTSSRLKLRM